MCTPEQAKEESVKAIEETLFEPDQYGNTRFRREVHDAVFADGNNGQPSRFQRELKKAFYTSIGKWLIGGGITIVIAGSLLYAQVQENAEALSLGDRYTLEDHKTYVEYQKETDLRQDEAIASLRSDTNESFKQINAKLDRLIESLIP